MNTKNYFLLIAFLLVSNLLAEDSYGSHSETNLNISTNSEGKKYKFYTAPNGLKILLISDKNAKSAAVVITVYAGSVNEPDQQLGLAHYVEHIVATDYGSYLGKESFRKFIRNQSGYFNAETLKNKTRYFYRVSNESLSESLYKLSDMIFKPSFDSQKSKEEVLLVNDEWAKDRGSDIYIENQIDSLTKSPSSPDARFIIGNSETLKDKKGSLITEEAKKFYAAYYQPKNMQIIIVSEKSIEQLTYEVNENFSEPQGTAQETNKSNKKIEADSLYPKKIFVAEKIEDNKLYIDLPIQKNSHINTLNLQLFNSLFNSREKYSLYDWLKTKNYINDFSASHEITYQSEFDRIAFLLTDSGMQNRNEIIAATFNYIRILEKSEKLNNYYQKLKIKLLNDPSPLNNPDSLSLALYLAVEVEYLSIENIINATRNLPPFNKAEINSLTSLWRPQNSRVWFVSKNEVGTQDVPFFDAKYSTADITTADLISWKLQAGKAYFKFPIYVEPLKTPSNPLAIESLMMPYLYSNKSGVETFVAKPNKANIDDIELLIELNNGIDDNSNIKNRFLANMLAIIYQNKLTNLIYKIKMQDVNILVSIDKFNIINLKIFGGKNEVIKNLSKIVDTLNFSKISNYDYEDAAIIFERSQEYNNSLSLKLESTFGRYLFSSVFGLENHEKIINSLSELEINKYVKTLKSHLFLRTFFVGNLNSLEIEKARRELSFLSKNYKLLDHPLYSELSPPGAYESINIPREDKYKGNAFLCAFFHSKTDIINEASIAIINNIINERIFDELRTRDRLSYKFYSQPLIFTSFYGYKFYIESSSNSFEKINRSLELFIVEIGKAIENFNDSDLKNEKIKLLTSNPLIDLVGYEIDFYNRNYLFDSENTYRKNLNDLNVNDIKKAYKEMFLENRNSVHIEYKD